MAAIWRSLKQDSLSFSAVGIYTSCSLSTGTSAWLLVFNSSRTKCLTLLVKILGFRSAFTTFTQAALTIPSLSGNSSSTKVSFQNIHGVESFLRMRTSPTAISAPLRFLVIWVCLFRRLSKVGLLPLIGKLLKEVSMMFGSSCQRWIGADYFKMATIWRIDDSSAIDQVRRRKCVTHSILVIL